VGYSDGGGSTTFNGLPVNVAAGSITTAGSGSQFVTLGGGFDDVGTSSWEQLVPGFVPGNTYVLTFKMASENAVTGQSITVDFRTGSSTPAQTFTAAASPASYWKDWESKSMTFVANATSVDLRFSATTQFDVGLDDVSVTPTVAPALVVNGSFEDAPGGFPTGWTHSGSDGDSGATVWRVGYSDGGGSTNFNGSPVAVGPGSITVTGDGSQFVTMGGGFDGVGSSSWEQLLAGLTPGSTYTLTFKMASENTVTSQSITVDFPTGSSTPAETFTAAASPASYWRDWESKAMTFVATAPSVDLRFSATTQFDVGLDDVSVLGPPPVIYNVFPHFGHTPGAEVALSGTGFQSGSKVSVGGMAATTIGTPTATSLSFIAPNLPLGPNDVEVLNPDGTSGLLAGGFYALGGGSPVADPSQSSVSASPTSIPVGGTAVVTLTARDAAGNPLTSGGSTFSFGLGTGTGSGTFSNLKDNNDGTYTATFTGSTGGQITITGTLDGRTISSALPTVTVRPAPAVSELSPSMGLASGGTTVVITGTGFQPTSEVFFDGIAATVIGIPTSASITVVTPALPVGPADIKIINPDGQFTLASSAFVAQIFGDDMPVIGGISPNSGPVTGGTQVTVSGTGFDPGSKVFIGGIAAAVAGIRTATTITVISPVLPAGPNDVKVVNPNGLFSVLPGAFFATGAPPVINNVSPHFGHTPGAMISIAGTGFQPGCEVYIGGVAATLNGVATTNTINVTVPDLPVGPADVEIVNPDGTNAVLAGGFYSLGSSATFSSPPVISSVSPSYVITISGTGFQPGSQVFIGGVAAALAGTPTPTTITVVTPISIRDQGTADVKVLNPDGQQAVAVGGFGVPSPVHPPVITSISPSGSSASGSLITISGTGFQATSKVFIGGVPATLSGIPTATTLTVVMPTVLIGPADVEVVNPDGEKTLVIDALGLSSPEIDNVLPRFGHTPNTVLAISGIGFQPGCQVFIGGVAASIVGTPTVTSVSVVTPVLPVGPTDIKVLNPDGTQALLANGFFALGGGPETFSPPPVISSISANAGFGFQPGSQVFNAGFVNGTTITGAGFQPGSQVFIGGVAASIIGTTTSTTINVITPANAIGLADVKVLNPDGQSVVLTDAFFPSPFFFPP
jgi:hypothetical protein